MDLTKILELDARLSARVRNLENSRGLHHLAGLLAHTGDSWFWLLGLVALFFLGPADWYYRAVLLAVGVLVTASIVLAIKFIVRRRRPEGDWGAIYRKSDPHSFPSGHAARGAMLAAMAIGVGPSWLAYILLFWAPAMSLARVAMGLHYLSDVLAGFVVGVLMAMIILQMAALFF
jgi:undecaprenyl-diphosphatase